MDWKNVRLIVSLSACQQVSLSLSLSLSLSPASSVSVVRLYAPLRHRKINCGIKREGRQAGERERAGLQMCVCVCARPPSLLLLTSLCVRKLARVSDCAKSAIKHNGQYIQHETQLQRFTLLEMCRQKCTLVLSPLFSLYGHYDRLVHSYYGLITPSTDRSFER